MNILVYMLMDMKYFFKIRFIEVELLCQNTRTYFKIFIITVHFLLKGIKT